MANQKAIGRNWLITANNMAPDDFKAILVANETSIQCCHWQQEKGQAGTEHIQACLTFKKNQRFSAVKKMLPTAHLELTHNVNASRVYCMKEDTRILGPFVFGELKETVTNKKLTVEIAKNLKQEEAQQLSVMQYLQVIRLQKELKSMTKLPPRTIGARPRGIWIIGPPGVGKSTLVARIAADAYIKQQTKWWCQYDGEPIAHLEDFDHSGAVLSHHLKIWADGNDFPGEIKGGRVNVTLKWFIITSNYSIADIWPGVEPERAVLRAAIERRFTVFELNDRRDQDEVLDKIQQFMDD